MRQLKCSNISCLKYKISAMEFAQEATFGDVTIPSKKNGATMRRPHSDRSLMLRCLIFLFFFVAAGFAGASARAAIADGTLPDGSYHCEVYLLGTFVNLGDIEIRGRVYSGPTYGSVMQGYNYEMNNNGEISWLGPVGGFTSGGNGISLTQATADGPSDASFDIIMRQPDGAFSAATCTVRTP